MKDIEEIISKVMAKYDSQILYDIIQTACIYRENDYSIDNVDELIDINISGIKQLIKSKEDDLFFSITRAPLDKYEYQKGDLSKFIGFQNISDDEKAEIKDGLKFLVILYDGIDKKILNPAPYEEDTDFNYNDGVYKKNLNSLKINITKQSLRKINLQRHSFSENKKTEFRHWLIEDEGKSYATANNYLCGIDAAQKHYIYTFNKKINFYSIKNVNELQSIFNKYIDGEFYEIGKNYSGAVRAGLKAYLRFLLQSNRIKSIKLNSICKNKESKFQDSIQEECNADTIQAFKTWMAINTKKTEQTTELYIQYLKQMQNLYNSENPPIYLFSFTNYEVSQIRAMLYNYSIADKYKSIGENKKRILRKAALEYASFLNQFIKYIWNNKIFDKNSIVFNVIYSIKDNYTYEQLKKIFQQSLSSDSVFYRPQYTLVERLGRNKYEKNHNIKLLVISGYYVALRSIWSDNEILIFIKEAASIGLEISSRYVCDDKNRECII